MSRKPRGKPSLPGDPAKRLLVQRQTDLEAVNLQPEAAQLATQSDVQVTRAGEKREGQTVKEDSARRLDAFAALKDGMDKGCYDAARRYELQVLVRRGENDRGPARERVDQTAGFTTDAMVEAAEWIEAVNKRLPPRDWWLLMELIAPRVDRISWRDTVYFITGETHTHAQGAVVRAMTINLRDAAEAVDKAEAEDRRKAA